jgi:hypothetical protein
MIKTLRYIVIALCALLISDLACMAASNEEPKPSSVDTESDPSAAATESEQQAISEEQRRAIQNYEQLVLQLQSSGGVYQEQLSEVLLSLGSTYQSLDLHTEAIAAFERSLHISRVNDGLYSLSQIVSLERLIESNGKLGNWKSLNKNYHNLYWISKRHYGANNPQMLALIDRIGRWHLKAYELMPTTESFSHLIDAEHLYNKSVEIIGLQNNKQDIRLINALYGIALTNYQIAVHVSSAADFEEIRTGYRDSNQQRRMLQEAQARQMLIQQSYIEGRDAMSRIVDIHANNPILPVDTHAIALTHLGDWYLLFNKRNSAAAAYDQAYKLLHDDGTDQQKIDLLFGRPRTLPAIRLPLQNEEDIVPENPPYVLASFDVSASGKARNIQIIESGPEDSVSLKRRARKSIAATRFRPRYENGKAVKTTDVSIRYIFTD